MQTPGIIHKFFRRKKKLRFLVTGYRRGYPSHVEGIPDAMMRVLPVAEIDADDEKEAREKLAQLFPGEYIGYYRVWVLTKL